MPSFPLKLENTYWSKGFFNVTVDNQQWVTEAEGPFQLFLGDASVATAGRVSRSANQNATPRIYGNKALATFFQAHFKPGESVHVEILSPTSMRIGAPTSLD